VANIAPGQTIAITIEYLEIVAQNAGRYSVRFPLTITPRYVPGVVADSGMSIGTETPIATLTPAVSSHDSATVGDLLPDFIDPDTSSQSVSFDIDIDAGAPIKDLASTYHAIKSETRADRTLVRLAEPRIAPDHDFELAWTPQIHGEPAAALFHERTDQGEHVLLMVMPPQEDVKVTTPREVIFVIDTSGSMEGESIRQARAALLKGLESLTPADRFTIIQFNSIFDVLFPQPVSATSSNLAAARQYVSRLRATGGTEMLPALSAALAMHKSGEHLRQIVFMTDGAVANEEQLMNTIRTRLDDARLFTIGIGSAPNGNFMRKAAQMGRGTFTYIGSSEEVDAKMSALLLKLTHPVLTDIELHWPNGVNAEYAPAQIGDLYAGEPVVVTARLPNEAKGLLSITGSASGRWIRQIPLEAIKMREGVATLWARRRIEDLMDLRASGAAADDVRTQILPLALSYQLVTDYTSLIAVDRTPVRPKDESLDSQRVPNTLPQGSEWQTVAYPKTATPAELEMILGLSLLFAAAAMFVYERRSTKS
jgi:Ca-activated chloride channel family protein